jgi:hypothetical protein
MKRVELFCGLDEREAVGFAVFAHSVNARASKPIAITALGSMGLPQGSNTFTVSRFAVAEILEHRGHGIFCDASDMLVMADVAELDALFDDRYAIQVVKHENYKTRNKVKYIGTSMECPNTNYERKNWASVMLVNAEHPAWRRYESAPSSVLQALQLRFLADDEIGELPAKWNCLADEGHDIEGAKILHWTAGVPGFPHYTNAPGAELWHRERKAMEHAG